MQTINYSTGRTYDAPQVLEIQILRSETDEFGWVFGKALFIDRSRYIAGTVDFAAISDSAKNIGESVLSGYDTGDYCAVSFNQFAK